MIGKIASLDPAQVTLWRDGGVLYQVPIYRPRPGHSVDAVARALGGHVVHRKNRTRTEREGRISAVVIDGGLVFPVEVPDAP